MPNAATPDVPPGDQAPEGRPALPPDQEREVNWNHFAAYFRCPPLITEGTIRVFLTGGGAAGRRALADTAAEREERARRKFIEDAAARALLLSMLDADNRVRLERKGYIEVTGSAGGVYRLWASSYSGNIQKLGRTRNGAQIVVRRLCAHPPMTSDLPFPPVVYEPYVGVAAHAPYDHALIAQMLALRYDEPGVLEVALDA